MGGIVLEPDATIEPDPVIEAYKKDVDRTLIRENLKLTVEERFRKHARMQRFALNLRKAGEQARQKAKAERAASA